MANTGTVGTIPGAGTAGKQSVLGGMEPADLERMIQAAAQRLVDQQNAANAEKQQLEVQGPTLPPALKVYLCDRYPGAKIQELDFSQTDDKGRHPPIKGQYITFRLGKFRAMTENQVKQIEWMMDNPTHNQFGEVIGGFPYIVEDIGESVYICRDCEPNFVTTNPDRFRTHRRTMHGSVSLDD
jgi:hypothetical protein